MIKNAFRVLFGTKNEKILAKYKKSIEIINSLEPQYQKFSDNELKNEIAKYKQKVIDNKISLDDIKHEVFAIVREASVRALGMRHYDVQLIGGLVLHDGNISEMKTGEGKTLVATLCVVLNALSGKGVHVVTVNDYLASRDAKEMGKLYEFLGFSVGVLATDQNPDEKKEQYAKDITYGTNNEYGFDFLRDNMVYDINDKVQRGHNYAIVDEVDSILIDEARTPLIISGPTSSSLQDYIKAQKFAITLKKGERIEPKSLDESVVLTNDFVVDEKNRNVLITDEGIEKAEKFYKVDNLYSMENAFLSHHIDQALKANYLFKKDVDYVLKDNQVVIVDEFTGRLSEGRRFSDGLHQALEAKEGVAIQEESQTLADITFQNYFRMYDKLSGMTGTAQTEATEFSEIYNLEVVSIPTNRPTQRQDLNDLIYRTDKEKYEAIATKIQTLHKKGQPILVGTTSVEKSEIIHKLLKQKNIPHSVLNAKAHEKESEIILNAGAKGSVCVATNMAGRGVDIKVPQESLDVGGLFVLGCERHESRRIDNQLIGRSGRQGDKGVSQFYLSLEDNLLRLFGSDKISGIMGSLGLKDGEHIESGMITRAVSKAQKKVESMHFDSRKHLLEYDDISAKQRKTIYEFRNSLLDESFDIQAKITQNIEEFVLNLENECNIKISTPKDDFDLLLLCEKLKEELSVQCVPSEFDFEHYDDLHNYLLQKIQKKYNNKVKIMSDEQKNNMLRMLYLQVLDKLYREHLYSQDLLKTGIGLRGYNQKDPLVEYKRESYNMFMSLLLLIKHEIIRIIFNITIQTNEDEEINKIRHKLKEANEHLTNNKEPIASKANAPKIARNAPCPCNSGKKYKQCCGKA